ncbi:MAG: helix-turn-helix domain-containing protein [Betaproteobacteria bacterium]|nr:helix-turn-helix domain-containing protein [Betaproteobacteria bacterium]
MERQLHCDTCVERADEGIRHSGLVDGLTDQEAAGVMHTVIRRRFDKGHALFRAGDRLRYLYVLSSGRVKTSTRTLDGRERVMGLCATGAVIGLEALGGEVTTVEASMLVDGEVLLLPLAALETLAGQNARLQRNLHRLVSRTIVHDYEVMRLLARSDVGERVAAFLLSLADHRVHDGSGGGSVVVRLPATRGDIASLLGMRSETFSRVLSDLRDSGVVRARRGDEGIELVSCASLARLCGTRVPRGAIVREGMHSG